MFSVTTLSKLFTTLFIGDYRILFFDGKPIAISNGLVTLQEEDIKNPAILRTISMYMNAPTKKKFPSESFMTTFRTIMREETQKEFSQEEPESPKEA